MGVPQETPYGQNAAPANPYTQQQQPQHQYGTVPQQQPQHQQQVTQQVTFVKYQHADLPRVNDWSVGLFDCFGDLGLCCDVYFCGLCQMSRQHDALLNGRQDSFNGAVCCGLFCCSWAQCCHIMYLRGALRAHHGLQGNTFTDCLAALFCGPCTVCQTHKQLKAHGANPGVTCCNSSTPVSSTPVPGAFVPQGPM